MNWRDFWIIFGASVGGWLSVSVAEWWMRDVICRELRKHGLIK